MAGGNDLRFLLNPADQLYGRMKKRGVPARLVVYPDEGHQIRGPTEAIHRLEELQDWFEGHDPGI